MPNDLSRDTTPNRNPQTTDFDQVNHDAAAAESLEPLKKHVTTARKPTSCVHVARCGRALAAAVLATSAVQSSATTYILPEYETRFSACVSKWQDFDGEWRATLGPDEERRLDNMPLPAPTLLLRLIVRARDSTLFLRHNTAEPWEEIATAERRLDDRPSVNKTQLSFLAISSNPKYKEAHQVSLSRRFAEGYVDVTHVVRPAATFMKMNTLIETIESRHAKAHRWSDQIPDRWPLLGPYCP